MIDVPLSLNGRKVVEDINMTVAGEPVKTKRTWRERLFSWPWKPFKSHNVTIPQIPSNECFMVDNYLIMHPTIVAELRKHMKRDVEL